MTEHGTAALGALVRAKRESHSLSMEELALRANVSRSSIHRIEHSHRVRPMPAKLARILEVLEVTPEEARMAAEPWGEEYANDLVQWMDRGEAYSQLAGRLQASPTMRHLESKPDLVAIDQDGQVSQVYGGNVNGIAACLEAQGWLVTFSRRAD